MILSLLMGMIKHSQITQSNKFPISYQYLKKEVRNGVHYQSFYDGKGQIYPCRDCFVFYCDAKHSDILRGSSHVHCYLFFMGLAIIIINNTEKWLMQSVISESIMKH